MTQDIRKERDCQSDNGGKVPPELDKIAKVVLAYRPEKKTKKKIDKQEKKNKGS